jgi:hypothetical protein
VRRRVCRPHCLRRFNEYLLNKENVQYPHAMASTAMTIARLMLVFQRATRLPSKRTLPTPTNQPAGKIIKFSAATALNIRLTLEAENSFIAFAII